MGAMTRSKLAKAASVQQPHNQGQNKLHALNTAIVALATVKTPRRSKRRVTQVNLDHESSNQPSPLKEVKTAKLRQPLERGKNDARNDSPTDMYSPSTTFSFDSNSMESSPPSTTHSFLLEEDNDAEYDTIKAAFLQERQTWNTEREQVQASIHATREELHDKMTDLLEKVSGLTADNERLHRDLAKAQKQLNALSEELNQTKTKYQSDTGALREVLAAEVPKGARLQRELDSQVSQFHSLEAKLQSEYENLRKYYHHIQSEFPEKLRLCVQQELDRMRTAMGAEEMNRVCQLTAENAGVVRQLAHVTKLSRHSQNGPFLRDERHAESSQCTAIPGVVDRQDSDGRNECQTTAPAEMGPSNLAKRSLKASQATNGNSQEYPPRKKNSYKPDCRVRQPRYLGQETSEAKPSRESKASTPTPLYNFVNVDFDSPVDPEPQARFLDEPKVTRHRQPEGSHSCIPRSVAAKGKDARRAAQHSERPLDKDDHLQRLGIKISPGGQMAAEADGQEDFAAGESSDEAMDISSS